MLDEQALEKLNLEKFLLTCCQCNDVENVGVILNYSQNIDILYKDGKFFALAISNDSAEILRLLVDYFEQTTRNKFSFDSYEYLAAKADFITIIEHIDLDDACDEVRGILAPYERQYSDENRSVSDMDEGVFFDDHTGDTDTTEALGQAPATEVAY